MDGNRIERLLRADSCTCPMLLGIFAADKLPRRLQRKRPLLLVCNTDPSHKPGQHWVVLYIGDNGYGEYFDSFGRLPETVFSRYLDRFCRHWNYNSRQLQSVLSQFCGHYCIVYCMLRSRGHGVNSIANLFTRNATVNDYLVHRFVCGK